MPTRIIGKLNTKVIQILELNTNESQILIGDQNEDHMKIKHPNDYDKYFCDITNILDNPTYVTKHPKGSIEYIKEYTKNNERVLVAVRATKNQVYFARTLFIMTETKFNKYKNKGLLFKL